MAMEQMGRDRDLVLAPGEYAYVLDTTKGLVNTIVGPNKVSMSNTDQPVVWDTKARRFMRCEADKSIQIDSIAPEGFYIALYNPAEKHPTPGTSSIAVPMQVGNRTNIPGPVNFSLWPGQMAKVILGHHLHSNQYLLAQVYNDVEATKNWKEAVVKPVIEGVAPTPRDFTPGQLLIIKGTEVAFFIPPTGIKVVPENDKYIRDAVTLERLEYCILLDEDGNKRFVQGPDVVFPEPTEQFVIKDGSRKFRAIELNETTGIYVKVIADYEEKGNKYESGDELFITGKEQAIYFQREEHSVIRYGDQTKHYAVAVPAGEGRYVLNRNTGVITLVRGPKMLLCDPRSEVIVRRVLAENTVKLWYPDNPKVIAINKELELLNEGSPGASQYLATSSLMSSNNRGLAALNYADEAAVQSSRQIMGDSFQRGNKFTPPRTITLDTKYEGAIGLSIWTGYAVLIVSKTGKRQVVVGPNNLLLEYDETLAPLQLSMGKPKSSECLFRTVYLLVHNNRVSDIVSVETNDLVKLKLHVAYRVNFEGDNPEKWFEVENYVRLLTDHMRSFIRNVTKRKGIEEFYTNAIDIIRDAVLGANIDGKGRPGRVFTENNMRVYDLEVLEVTIDTPNVATLLGTAQMNALESTIKIAQEERQLEFTRRSELIKRAIAIEKAQTIEETNETERQGIAAILETSLARVKSDSDLVAAGLTEKVAQQVTLNQLNTEQLAREKEVADQKLLFETKRVELELRKMLGETEEIVKRTGAVDANLATALTAFSDASLVEKITTTLAPMAAMNGVSAADILSQLFKGTPFEGVMKQLGTRTRMPVGNGAIQ